MGLLKKEVKSNFTIVNNSILHDKNLDAKLRGLLITMLSLPPDWNFSITGLQEILPDGRSAIAAGLKKLEQFGYLVRTKIRDKKGRIIDIDYTIFDESQLLVAENKENEENDSVNIEQGEEYVTENTGSIKKSNSNTYDGNECNEECDCKESSCKKCDGVENNSNKQEYIYPKTDYQESDYPYVDFPHMDNPHMESPHMENRPQLNTNKLNTKKLNIKQSIYPSINCNDDMEIDGIDRQKKHNCGELANSKKLAADYEKYREIIKGNIEYDYLAKNEFTYDIDGLDGIIEIMTEMVVLNKEPVKINGSYVPAEIVKSRFLQITGDEIAYMQDVFSKTTTKVHNIRAYLITALYNSKSTKSQYYDRMVKYDLYGGE